MMQAQQQTIRSLVLAEYERARTIFNDLPLKPEFTIKIVKTCRLGAFKPFHRELHVSSHIVNEDELLDTIRHELAHYVDWVKCGRPIFKDDRIDGWKPHGHQWKAIAVKLGATPRARSNKELSVDYKYLVVCPSGCQQGYMRRSKVVNHPSHYRCRKHKLTLKRAR